MTEVAEGHTGTTDATFEVTLSRTATTTVTVNCATADSAATAPEDYVRSSGTLTFAPGETSKTITVPVVGDTVYEPHESFVVTLTGATIADGHGAGTIVDDDPAPGSGKRATLSVADVRVNEGDVGTTSATFEVSLSTPSAQSVAVDYGTANRTATLSAAAASTSSPDSLPAGTAARTPRGIRDAPLTPRAGGARASPEVLHNGSPLRDRGSVRDRIAGRNPVGGGVATGARRPRALIREMTIESFAQGHVRRWTGRRRPARKRHEREPDRIGRGPGDARRGLARWRSHGRRQPQRAPRSTPSSARRSRGRSHCPGRWSIQTSSRVERSSTR